MEKQCVLYDRQCVNCGECDICDLDPKKICDNCGRCIESGNDYNIVDVDLTPENGDEPLNYHFDNEIEEVEDEFFVEENFEDDFPDDIEDDVDDCDEQEDDYSDFDFGEFFGKR